MLLFIVKRAERISTLEEHVLEVVRKTGCLCRIILAASPYCHRSVDSWFVMVGAHVDGQTVFKCINSRVKRVSWNGGVWVRAGFVLVHNGRTGD